MILRALTGVRHEWHLLKLLFVILSETKDLVPAEIRATRFFTAFRMTKIG